MNDMIKEYRIAINKISKFLLDKCITEDLPKGFWNDYRNFVNKIYDEIDDKKRENLILKSILL